jgi:hypothetical protein
MLSKVPDQALHGLVLHHTDADISRVFQARSKKVDSTSGPTEELDVHLPEVVLAKFPRKTLETNQRFYILRTKRSHQGV